MSSHKKFKWDPESEKKLQELATTGMKPGEIRKHFPGATTSAIRSKMRRLKDPLIDEEKDPQDTKKKGQLSFLYD